MERPDKRSAKNPSGRFEKKKKSFSCWEQEDIKERETNQGQAKEKAIEIKRVK